MGTVVISPNASMLRSHAWTTVPVSGNGWSGRADALALGGLEQLVLRRAGQFCMPAALMTGGLLQNLSNDLDVEDDDET
ncbi:hypothetical protein [Streptomyces sp. ME19-01-6]|uniref:hypothetical protein n=1 Tax=Streptomyces sp. ME19-01-6 TaxID=3028686 RepID=UPI0029ABAA82|nr:hypothetical protein [Streptomyces sp. ME19-01-6]MDX3233631.1 hypothetical protein [Streptomyces sp. ME19-01-6]